VNTVLGLTLMGGKRTLDAPANILQVD